jgi:hypothetical protein
MAGWYGAVAVVLAAAPAVGQSISIPPAASPPPACSEPEHRHFDFWVGKWDVYATGKAKLVAHSLIEKLYSGCTIRENWMPLSGNGGSSLNMYDPGDRRWHQTWQDSHNGRAEFDGGLVDGKMVLLGYWRGVGGPGKDAWMRITWTRNGDGSVRQSGYQSDDHGVTWTEAFDLTYRPAAN